MFRTDCDGKTHTLYTSRKIQRASSSWFVTALARERGVTRARRSLLPQWRVRRRSVTPIR